jgi:hypothetical protein
MGFASPESLESEFISPVDITTSSLSPGIAFSFQFDIMIIYNIRNGAVLFIVHLFRCPHMVMVA